MVSYPLGYKLRVLLWAVTVALLCNFALFMIFVAVPYYNTRVIHEPTYQPPLDLGGWDPFSLAYHLACLSGCLSFPVLSIQLILVGYNWHELTSTERITHTLIAALSVVAALYMFLLGQSFAYMFD